MKSHVRERITDCLSRNENFDANGIRAYCFLLYGSNPTEQMVSNVLTVAYSLRDSKHQKIILLTPDVPESVSSLISRSGTFDRVCRMDYIMANIALFKKDWFREVFTKFHIFNLTDFEKVVFLDLDMAIREVSSMDAIFDLPVNYGAMENSKNEKSGSMWLSHGESMGKYCKLINAGLIIVRPCRELFDILVSDVTSESADHVPGITPEQFYLARVMGEHFHHISQRFNFEVQLHGGVPRTPLWNTLEFEEIVCFHFSGGQPLKRISALSDPEWGCQTEKRMILSVWNSEISIGVKNLANERARKAFGFWALNFALACKLSRAQAASTSSEFDLLLQYGHSGEGGLPTTDLRIGDTVDEKFVAVRLDPAGFLLVDTTTYNLSFKPLTKKPTRAAPRLPTSIPAS